MQQTSDIQLKRHVSFLATVQDPANSYRTGSRFTVRNRRPVLKSLLSLSFVVVLSESNSGAVAHNRIFARRSAMPICAASLVSLSIFQHATSGHRYFAKDGVL